MTTSSGTVRTPSGPWPVRGLEGRELKHKCHLTILSFLFRLCDMWLAQCKSTKTVWFFCSDWLSVKSESRGEYSICQPSPPPLFLHVCSESEGGGHEEVLTVCFVFGFFLEGDYFDCLYLSGVNFQALSSFWACSSLSLVCSSSAFILRKNKLMDGSTMDDRSWATLGCWTCLRYWIWVCRIQQTRVSGG